MGVFKTWAGWVVVQFVAISSYANAFPSRTVCRIMLVDESSEAMLISQFGKIIRIDTKTIREAGRSTQGVCLLNLEAGAELPQRWCCRQRKRKSRKLLQ